MKNKSPQLPCHSHPELFSRESSMNASPSQFNVLHTLTFKIAPITPLCSYKLSSTSSSLSTSSYNTFKQALEQLTRNSSYTHTSTEMGQGTKSTCPPSQHITEDRVLMMIYRSIWKGAFRQWCVDQLAPAHRCDTLRYVAPISDSSMECILMPN